MSDVSHGPIFLRERGNLLRARVNCRAVRVGNTKCNRHNPILRTQIFCGEAEHPAPELPESVPTAEERLTALEGAMLAMMGVKTDV